MKGADAAVSHPTDGPAGDKEPPSQWPVPTQGRVDGSVTQRRVIASELVKFVSLRSTVLVLAAAMLAMVAFGAIIAFNTRNPVGQDPEDLVASGPLQGYYLGQLLMGALGVLIVSGEYSTGMIRATLAAVPTRTPVLIGKAVVFVAVAGVLMTAASVAAFFAAQAMLSGYRPIFSLSDGDTLRVVIGTGVYLTLVGLIGSALAWMVRSTPGALVATLAIILVLPLLFELVFPSWGDYIAAYLPTGAGASFSTNLPQPHALSPWLGLGVMVAWVVIGLCAALAVLRRRDA